MRTCACNPSFPGGWDAGRCRLPHDSSLSDGGRYPSRRRLRRSAACQHLVRSGNFQCAIANNSLRATCLLFAQRIADAAHRVNEHRVAELAADVTDVHVERVRVRAEVEAPDLRGDLMARHDAADVAKQE